MPDLQYDIREGQDPEGGIVLELWVDGACVSTATASANVLEQMAVDLGTAREDMRALLEEKLVENFKQQLAKVELTPPKAIPAGGLRFVSRYVYRDFGNVYAGVVWYDVPTGKTGPEDLSALVRNKMRTEVHRHLTEASPNARVIVDLSK